MGPRADSNLWGLYTRSPRFADDWPVARRGSSAQVSVLAGHKPARGPSARSSPWRVQEEAPLAAYPLCKGRRAGGLRLRPAFRRLESERVMSKWSGVSCPVGGCMATCGDPSSARAGARPSGWISCRISRPKISRCCSTRQAPPTWPTKAFRGSNRHRPMPSPGSITRARLSRARRRARAAPLSTSERPLGPCLAAP